MSSGTNASGSGSDCEGEEQEDPSSSLRTEAEISDAFSLLDIQNQVESKANEDPDDELSTFRQQWQRELESTPPNNVTPKMEAPENEDDNNDADNEAFQREAKEKEYSDFEKARCFFLLAAKLERAGCWYESIQNYKRALAINPNIELLLYQQDILEQEKEESPEEEMTVNSSQNEPDDEEEMVEGEDLLTRIQRIQARKGVLCEPAVDIPGAHISWLPYEVLTLVARWVVSAELDAGSLERLGACCRGLYLLARDQDIWRNICIRTWGVECGTPRAHGCGSWRQMFVSRPRLQLHGCYISRTSYVRHGEACFQDRRYGPWFLVQYYRYLRFFSDGAVMMLTTPDEPAMSVSLLTNRSTKGAGVMVGHYRLRGDKVVIVIKKNTTEKKSVPMANTRFRSRRREPEPQEREQTFHIELELLSSNGRRNSRLAWRGYSVSARRNQWSHFELCPDKFPALAFSRVRHYTSEAAAPLAPVPLVGPHSQ